MIKMSENIYICFKFEQIKTNQKKTYASKN